MNYLKFTVSGPAGITSFSRSIVAHAPFACMEPLTAAGAYLYRMVLYRKACRIDCNKVRTLSSHARYDMLFFFQTLSYF